MKLLTTLALWMLPVMAMATDVTVVGMMSDRAIVRIDGQQQLLKVGETRQGVTLVRVSAESATLRVDGVERQFGLGSSTGMSQRRKQSVTVSMNRYGQYLTNGQINGRVVEFLVDTGANTVSMTTQDARELGIDFRAIGKPGQSYTANGVVRSWIVTLDSVKVGPIEVRNVMANIRDTPKLGPMLLGMTYLNSVSLLHENNRLHLTSR